MKLLYIGESCGNFETGKQEHEDVTKKISAHKDLRQNPNCSPSGHQEILQSMVIAKFQPRLNKQVYTYRWFSLNPRYTKDRRHGGHVGAQNKR